MYVTQFFLYAVFACQTDNICTTVHMYINMVKTNLELPSVQKEPAVQAPEHRKLVSFVEEPNLPAAHGNLIPFVQ